MSPAFLVTSRSRVLAAILFSVVAIFALRLFYIQVIQHDYYSSLADSEQLKKERIPATRGIVYVKDGDEAPRPLVMNETVYTVFADPAVVEDVDKVVDVMKRVAGGNVRKDFEALLEKTESRYQILATKVTRLQADKIKDEHLYGIGFQAMSQRMYPEGALAGQLLGFVDTEGVGQYGLESALNDELKGIDGRLETVTDVSDVPLTIGDRNIREPAQDGKDVVLSIDRNIQSYAEHALAAGLQRTGATEGSVVVMDPRSGKVMAMANLPTYHPGEYFKVTDPALFNNNVISNPYEPGSVIKTFMLATGLDKGVIRPNDTFTNTDRIVLGEWTIENFTKGRTGVISFQTALEWSLNTGFVTIAQRLGDGTTINRGARDTIYEYYHDRFRLTERTGIELANEAKGSLAAPDTGEGNSVKYANVSFGQGMTSTMIQVATGFSTLVNGGSYYKPTVIDGEMKNGAFVPTQSPAPVATGLITKETSTTLRTMMEDARRSAFSRLDKSGYRIGGKTGTAQVATPGGYSRTDTIGSYLGYGGADMPEYVIMVSVSGKGRELQGSRDAMPIFTDISNWLIDYLRIQPKG